MPIVYKRQNLLSNTTLIKLFAGQGSVTDGQTDGQSDDYMLHSSGHIIMYYNFYHNDYISVPLSILAKVTRTRMTDVTVELINTIHLQFQLSAKIKSFSATEIHVL